jgi:NADH:ubiquinone oxidoreductase subunit 5 (chain L)/Multisubunit Na+/H+ antiporter, MnhA subunit
MKLSTIFLVTILGVGLLYSIYKLFTGQGGGGLGDFFDGLGYTSLILFVASLTIIVFHIRQIKKYADTFLFLLLGLPMTIMAANGLVHNINYDRTPNLRAMYPRPFSQNIFLKDSLHIAVQVDSLIALRNRETGGTKVVSAFVDTIIYSESGKEIFVVYAQQFEPNDLGNDLDPAYLSADEKDSVYWHLQEGTPNAEQMSGSYHNVADLKKAVRKFYFNQYRFLEKDSLKENYFWKRKSKL